MYNTTVFILVYNLSKTLRIQHLCCTQVLSPKFVTLELQVLHQTQAARMTDIIVTLIFTMCTTWLIRTSMAHE